MARKAIGDAPMTTAQRKARSVMERQYAIHDNLVQALEDLAEAVEEEAMGSVGRTLPPEERGPGVPEYSRHAISNAAGSIIYALERAMPRGWLVYKDLPEAQRTRFAAIWPEFFDPLYRRAIHLLD